MTEENRRANARSEASLHDDALRAADLLLEGGLPNDAVSRAYYAAFHYARSLLLTEGLEPKTHHGVTALLVRHLEGPDRLTAAATSSFARLQTFRSLADYDARERLSRERAEQEVAAAHRFVDEARALLRSRGCAD